ncbi:MAG: AHH domain-containing protein [Puniceicoccales bacterium]|nr:AHH domain-containing protein [Puniceicoccales bacterium]
MSQISYSGPIKSVVCTPTVLGGRCLLWRDATNVGMEEQHTNNGELDVSQRHHSIEFAIANSAPCDLFASTPTTSRHVNGHQSDMWSDVANVGKIVTPQKKPEKNGKEMEKDFLADHATPETKKVIKEFFQRHHIIPRSVWDDYYFSTHLLKLGFSLDDDSNLVSLPVERSIPGKIENITTPSSGKAFGLRALTSSLHVGAHSIEYGSYIRIGLIEIFENKNADDGEKANSVRNLISDIRAKLLDGSLNLSNAEVPHGVKIVKYRRNKRFQYIGGYFRVHHVIPREIFRDVSRTGAKTKKLRTLKKGLKFLGFYNPDFFENLCALPISSELPKFLDDVKTPNHERSATGRSPHNGSHPKYTDEIRDQLRQILAKLDEKMTKNSEIKVAMEEAKNGILKMLADTAESLCSGEIRIQSRNS